MLPGFESCMHGIQDCMTLNKSFNPSEPQFPHLEMGMKILQRVAVRLEGRCATKCLVKH